MKIYEMAEQTETEERKWNCHQHVAKCSGSPHPHFPPSYLSSFHSCTDDLNGNDLHLRQWRSPNLISYLPLPSLSPLITHTHTQNSTVALQTSLYVFPSLPSPCQVMPRSPYSDSNSLCHFIRANSLSGFTDLTSESSWEMCATVAGICPSVMIFKCF